MGNSESGPLESSLGFFVQKLSKNSIRLHTAFLYHDWISHFFLISNQIEDKKKKSETPQNLFLPMTIVMIHTAGINWEKNVATFFPLTYN